VLFTASLLASMHAIHIHISMHALQVRDLLACEGSTLQCSLWRYARAR